MLPARCNSIRGGRHPVTTLASFISNKEGSRKRPIGSNGLTLSSTTWLRYHANHGSLWAAREQYDESARRYRLALTHDPQLAEAHQGLGESLLELGFPGEAETCFREAMRIAPALPFPWLGLANLFAERGDLELSCESRGEALARRRHLPDAYVRLACNLKGGLPASDLQTMVAMLERKYLSDDNRSQLLFALAGVLDERGDHAGAAAKTGACQRIASFRAGGGVSSMTSTNTPVSSTESLRHSRPSYSPRDKAGAILIRDRSSSSGCHGQERR